MYSGLPCASKGKCGCKKRNGLGAVNTKGLVTTGAGLATTAAVSSIGAGTAVGSFAGPIGAAVGLGVGLLLSANHPYGTCAPNAADMASFLKCWGHPIPANYMPIWSNGMWGGGGSGWVYCDGAQNGQPPAGGCGQVGAGGQNYCGPDGVSYRMPVGSGQPNTSGGPCAPPGTIQSIKGGGYDVSGSAASSAETSTLTAALDDTTGGIPDILLLALAGVAAYMFL